MKWNNTKLIVIGIWVNAAIIWGLLSFEVYHNEEFQANVYDLMNTCGNQRTIGR